MEEVDYIAMGIRIKEKRVEKKLTQEKLSELIDVSPSYISGIERGRSISSLSTIVKIANSLDTNLDYLIRGANSSNANSTFVELLNSIPLKNHNLFIDLCKNIANSLRN